MNNEIDLIKAAQHSHTDDALSGEYTFLHFTPENENTYKQGFFKGVDYAASLIKLNADEAPTVFRQTTANNIDKEDNSKLIN